MKLSLVMFQVLEVLVGFTTLLAHVRFVVCVRQQMPLVARVVFERLATLPTLERPHP